MIGGLGRRGMIVSVSLRLLYLILLLRGSRSRPAPLTWEIGGPAGRA
jgi:hypothetical protein